MISETMDPANEADVVEPVESGAAAETVERVDTTPGQVRNFPRTYSSLVDGCPVVGYTGANGAGKTLVAVSDACRDLSLGRPVYSTVHIDSPWGSSQPIKSLRQLLDIHDATILIDEVATVFSSRSTGSLPDEVVTFLQSMRHQGVTFRWTAPAWARAELLVREVTQVSVGVFGVGKLKVKGSFWRRPILVAASAFDVTTLAVDKSPEKPMFGKKRLYVPKMLPGWGRYDSLADVSRIGWQLQGGKCVDCGGGRKAELCTVDRHELLGIDVHGAADYGRPKRAVGRGAGAL